MKVDNNALLAVFLMGATAYRRGLSITDNPYKARQFWNAWVDGWRACQDRPGANRVVLNRAFKNRTFVADA